ncbi:MAG: helix-turn-helix transcriptional regulator [Pseudomonadota bacterium]
MKRLRELRLARGLTQKELAALLGTTQQTIGRWETGSSAPSVKSLDHLAHALGVTIEVILGRANINRDDLETANKNLNSDNTFWGHLGLLLPAEVNTRWFPISFSEMSRVWSIIRNMESDRDSTGGWITCETLNNKMLAFPSLRMNRIWFLDDDCDGPEGDWNSNFPFDDYAGHPEAIYRAMDEWGKDHAYGIGNDDAESTTRKKIAEELIRRAGFSEDPDSLMAFLHNTTVIQDYGKIYSYEVEADDLWSAMMDIETGFNKFMYLPSVGGDFDSFYPLDRTLLIVAPLTDITDAADREIKSLER